jgi:tetratricopeptide (TPR) repeat protein
VQVVHACLRCDPQQRPVDVQTVARAWAEGAVTASGWSIDTVGEAERLAPVPESVGLGAPPLDPAGDTVSIGSDETFGSWGLETSGAPTTEVPPSPTVEEPSPVPQEEQPTRWSARVAAVAVMVGGLGLAAWTVGWPEGAVVEVPRVEVLTVDEVPAVSDDPAQQEAMERGWAALLEGDVDGALRRLTVAAQAEHPLPALLRSYALMRGGDLAGSLSATRDVRRRWEGADGATGSLLSVVAAQQDQGRIDVPEVGAHRQAWPDDLYGRLMEADYCAMIDRAACEAAVPALLERAPTAPLAWQVAAEAWMELGDASRALSVVDRGLAVSPLDPTLLTFRAQLQLGADDLQAARVTLRQLVEVSPGQLTPKLLRVKLATLADDRALLEALSAELTSLSQPASVRRAFHEAHADCLEGLGRAREADAALARAEDDAMASGAVEEAYLLRLRRRSVAIRASWHEQAAEHLEAARTMASRSPEIPDVQRNRLMSMTMVDEALAQVRAGRLSEAETLLRRMEVGESIPPGALDRVRRELAVQRGDVPAIRASMASVWDGEATLRALLVGALTRAGRPELALEALSEGEPVAWRLHTEQRQLAVGLAVSEAEARLAVGDDPTDAVQRAQRLWPSPDPDHGLAMRLASLSEAISAR